MTTTFQLRATRVLGRRAMGAFAPIGECVCAHAHLDHTYFPDLYPCRRCICQQFWSEQSSGLEAWQRSEARK